MIYFTCGRGIACGYDDAFLKTKRVWFSYNKKESIWEQTGVETAAGLFKKIDLTLSYNNMKDSDFFWQIDSKKIEGVS